MGGLGHVCGVDAVMIWNILEVVVLQGPEEVEEHLPRDLEGLDQVPLLDTTDIFYYMCWPERGGAGLSALLYIHWDGASFS